MRDVLAREARRAAGPLARDLVDIVQRAITQLRREHRAIRNTAPQHFQVSVNDDTRRADAVAKRRRTYAL
jgi:hypothetical protein